MRAIVDAEPIEPPAIGRVIEGCPLAGANVAVETRSRIIRTATAWRMVAKNECQPPAIAVAHRLEEASFAGRTVGVVAAGLTPSVNTGAIPSSRSSNKAISEKKASI